MAFEKTLNLAGQRLEPIFFDRRLGVFIVQTHASALLCTANTKTERPLH